jgi:hypothetical protein
MEHERGAFKVNRRAIAGAVKGICKTGAFHRQTNGILALRCNNSLPEI